MDERELHAMIAADEHHWWYRGRRAILRSVIGDLPLPPASQTMILDAGCGSGRTLDDLVELGRVVGIDASPACVEATSARGHEALLGTVDDLPFEDASFDLVTCLDVLEHTPDDVRTLRELRRVTRPRGFVVVTVPAYPALWSRHDQTHGHYRRYGAGDVTAAATRAHLDVVRTTFFNTMLLLPAAAVRVVRRYLPDGWNGRSELDFTPRFLDGLLELPMRLESKLLARRWRLPAGLSQLAVLQPPASTYTA